MKCGGDGYQLGEGGSKGGMSPSLGSLEIGGGIVMEVALGGLSAIGNVERPTTNSGVGTVCAVGPGGATISVDGAGPDGATVTVDGAPVG